MNCAGCNKSAKLEPLAPCECGGCGRLGFYCVRCRRQPVCTRCAPDAPSAPKPDPLARPWPPEAHGCAGCVMEIRTGERAPFGRHSCGADEMETDSYDEAPPDVREPPVRVERRAPEPPPPAPAPARRPRSKKMPAPSERAAARSAVQERAAAERQSASTRAEFLEYTLAVDGWEMPHSKLTASLTELAALRKLLRKKP